MGTTIADNYHHRSAHTTAQNERHRRTDTRTHRRTHHTPHESGARARQTAQRKKAHTGRQAGAARPATGQWQQPNRKTLAQPAFHGVVRANCIKESPICRTATKKARSSVQLGTNKCWLTKRCATALQTFASAAKRGQRCLHTVGGGGARV